MTVTHAPPIDSLPGPVCECCGACCLQVLCDDCWRFGCAGEGCKVPRARTIKYRDGVLQDQDR